MARVREIPPNTAEEEKAIGGVLTFVQFFWLLGGAILGLSVYLLIYFMLRVNAIAIPLGVIVATSGLPFAFYKKKEMTFFQYLTRKSKFNKKSKKLINRRSF